MKKLQFSPLDGPVLLLLAAAGLGLLPAYDRAGALPALAAMWAGGVVYGVVRLLASDERIELRIATWGVWGGGLVALLFISQYGHYNPLEKVGIITRLAQILAAPFPVIPFWQPVANGMATLFEGLLFLAVGCSLLQTRPTARRITAASAGLIGLAIVISESRGAWLAVAAAGLIWAGWYSRPARTLGYAAGALLLVLAGMVVVTGDLMILERIPLVRSTLAPLFIRPDRLEVYQGSAALLRDVPFSGIGLGQQFAMNYSRYALLIQVPFLTYAHNFYLETWLELGLAGISALVWLAAAMGQMTWAARKTGGHDVLFEGAWLGLGAVLIHGLTDARPYSDLWCWPPIFLLMGLTAAAGLRGRIIVRRGWLAPAAAGVFVLAVLAGSAPVTAAWQTNLGSLRQARGELNLVLSSVDKEDDLRTAEVYFRRALAVQPGQESASLRLGLILTDREQFDEALPHLEAAYRAGAGRQAARKALGLGYVWVGQTKQAAELLQPLPDMYQEMNSWGYWRGTRGQAELARFAYQTSLLLNPAQPDVVKVLEGLK